MMSKNMLWIVAGVGAVAVVIYMTKKRTEEKTVENLKAALDPLTSHSFSLLTP